MNIYIVCAWYEVGMRHYSFTILNNIHKFLPADYKLHVTLVLRKDKENYPELQALEGLDIDYVVIKNPYLNILSKIVPEYFDNYVLKNVIKHKASLLYILFEGLFFKNIQRIQKHCKVMYTVHDLIPHEKSITTWKERWLTYTETKRGRCLIKNADYIITNFQGQYLQLKEQHHKPIFYTSMPTLINDHIANGSLKPTGLNLSQYILFFGRIDKYKGLEQLIQCHLDSDTEIPLVIAGSGNLWFKVPDTSMIILINRYIDDAEIKYLFEHAALTVLPYTSVTQTALISIPFYFKCPVMLSDITEFSQLAKKSGSVICDFQNADQYNGYIKKILSDNDFRNNVISRQSNFYNENYSPIAFIDNLKGVFDEIQGKVIS